MTKEYKTREDERHEGILCSRKKKSNKRTGFRSIDSHILPIY